MHIVSQANMFGQPRVKWLFPSRKTRYSFALEWRHNVRDGVSNHRRLDRLHNRFLRRRSKKTSKLRATGLWEGNPLMTSEFPAQMASNAENVSIWWRHHSIADICGAKSLSWCFIETPEPTYGKGNHERALVATGWHPWSYYSSRYTVHMPQDMCVHVLRGFVYGGYIMSSQRIPVIYVTILYGVVRTVCIFLVYYRGRMAKFSPWCHDKKCTCEIQTASEKMVT